MNGLGTRIRELRRRQGILQAEMSEALGASRSAIAMWENGHREPPLDMLSRIAAVLHVSLAELLSDDASPVLTPVQTRKVPLFNTAEPMPAIDTAPRLDVSDADCDLALRVADDSMAPTLLPGDTVFLRSIQPASDGQIVAVLLGGKLCLKRLYRSIDACTLLSDNPRHAPVSVAKPELMGVAVAYRRPLLP